MPLDEILGRVERDRQVCDILSQFGVKLSIRFSQKLRGEQLVLLTVSGYAADGQDVRSWAELHGIRKEVEQWSNGRRINA